MDLEQRRSILAEASPFSLLTPDEQTRLAAHMTERFLKVGETLFERGDTGDAFYVIASGRARVIGTDPAGREVSLSVLKRGDHFGEVALVRDTPRTATVRAAEDLVLLQLERPDFLKFLKDHPHVQLAVERYLHDIAIRDFLKQFTALAQVPAPLLRQVLEELREQSFAEGTAIVRQGEAGDTFYIVREGMLEVTERENGTERTLRAIGPGEFFGELALLGDGSRVATVIARTPARLYVMSRPTFEKISAGSPEFRHRLEQVAAAYTRHNPRTESPATIIALVTEHPEREEESAARLDTPRPSWRRWFRAYPFVQQHDETDCGAACLAMISKFYGVPVGVARLRDLANTDQDGASMWSMAHAAETLGFNARGLQLNAEGLSALVLPSIVLWEGFHYIVVYEMRGDEVIVGDPGIGIRTIPLEEFRRKWSGRPSK
jgi:subfamily B ATP-binding cassette protein HlyB/CyaB